MSAVTQMSWDLASLHVRPGERVVWVARPSLVGLLPILASALAAFAGLAVATYYGFEDPTAFVSGAPAFVLALLGIVAQAVRRFVQLRFTTFVVTDARFYAITSFLTTNARSVPLSRASHVSLHQGPFARMLGLWTARVSTYRGEREGQEARALLIPAIRDGKGLLREMSLGMRRGANIAWLRRGD